MLLCGAFVVDEIDESAVLQVGAVLLYRLADGVARLVEGVVDGLDSHLGEAVAALCETEVARGAERTRSDVLCSIAELASGDVKPLHAVGVVDREVYLDNIVIDKHALYRALHALVSETAHRGIEIGSLAERDSRNLHIVEQTQADSRAIDSLDVLMVLC